MTSLVLLCVFFVINGVYSADPRVDPLVKISQGLVRGRKATDGSYSSFLGIPYAAVDLDNPFGAAKPPPNFEEEIFIANDDSIQCPQTMSNPYDVTSHIAAKNLRDFKETLDCLRLNIYVPNQASSYNPLPVLVWIHGGTFSSGSSGEQDPRRLMLQGVVVVTINYRLGPYGFMCLDSPLVPGNQGLKDQHEALVWIRKNIAAFGGNPYSVTIAGQSAGSCSALLHLYSSKQKLFHKVIAESGTPNNEGMFVKGDTKAAIKLAEHLGFNTTETEEALSFLARTSPVLVTRATQDLNLVLRPCKEKSFSGIENFVENDPPSLSNEAKVKNTPIMIGHTNKEEFGSFQKYSNNYLVDPFYNVLKNNFNFDENQYQEIAEVVRHFYIGDEVISVDNMDVVDNIEAFLSDFIFNHPVQRMIQSLLNENAGPIYEYMFSYVGNSGEKSAGHSVELPYLFDTISMPSNDNEEATLLKARITTMWANFIKYGKPVPSTNILLPVSWEPISKKSRPYLDIDSELRMRSRVYHNRMSFWDLFYASYNNKQSLYRECLK